MSSNLNLCFGAKVTKIGIPLLTPVLLYKMGYKGVYITRTFYPAVLSLASLLWDIGKQYSPRCDAAVRGVPSGAILFA